MPRLKELLSDADSEVAEEAADALSLIGTEEAFEALVEYEVRTFLQHTAQPFPPFRFARISSAAAQSAIEARLGQETSPLVRAFLVCSWVGETRDDLQRFLRLALHDDDSLIAAWAAIRYGLAKFEDSCAVLVNLLDLALDERRVGAILGLEYLGDTRAVEPLFKVGAEPSVEMPRYFGRDAAVCLRELFSRADVGGQAITVQDRALLAALSLLDPSGETNHHPLGPLRDWAASSEVRRRREMLGQIVAGPHGGDSSHIVPCPNRGQ
ncbi:MAG: hypothetical protein U0271_43430 [Polyangiaceae bacterium]